MFFALVPVDVTSAEDASAGGVIIAIQDGTQHSCVNVSTHTVSMTLVAAQLRRSNDWWTRLASEERALGVKFDVLISDRDGRAVQFPRANQLSPPARQSDIAILPMRLPIMSQYVLEDGSGRSYRDLTLNLYFLTVRGESEAARTLNTLVSFSQNLQLPPNPYSTGADYFGRFANQLIRERLQDNRDAVPDASFSFGLASTTTQATACPESALREGVQAAIFDYPGTLSPNMIQISAVDDYCFWISPTSQRIRFQSRPSTGTCAATAPSAAKNLDNPLVAFRVEAWERQPAPTTTVSAARLLSPDFLALRLNSALDEPSIAEFTDDAFDLGDAPDPDVVQRLLQATDRSRINATQLNTILDNASVEEARAAIALRRCTLVGLEPADCQ